MDEGTALNRLVVDFSAPLIRSRVALWELALGNIPDLTGNMADISALSKEVLKNKTVAEAMHLASCIAARMAQDMIERELRRAVLCDLHQWYRNKRKIVQSALVLLEGSRNGEAEEAKSTA